LSGVRRQLALFLRTISINSLFRSGCQGSTPLGAGGGDDGIKLTPDGDEDGRPTSMVFEIGQLEEVD
jgi:hypothetical protein